MLQLFAVLLIAVILVALFAQIISAQTIATAQPGRVEKEENCPVLKPYGELDKFGKFYFPETVYEEARTQTEYECHHIWYLSDEIPVSRYIFKPKAMHCPSHLPTGLRSVTSRVQFAVIRGL